MSRCAGCSSELLPNKSSGPKRKWCSEKCRRDTSYVRECVDCGRRLNSSDGNGPNAPTRCLKCAAVASGAAKKVWTREAVIHAVRAWADKHGEAPSKTDWSVHHARVVLRDEERALRAERGQRMGTNPSFHAAVREFGSWNAAIEAAGFTPRAPHGGEGNQRRRRTTA